MPATPHRFGSIALTGPPNVGKSTLLNRIMGEKISIISRRPQTTRHRILGIKTLPAAQLVLVDTPGLHTAAAPPRRSLNRAIHRTALAALADVDLIAFLIDHRGWTPPLRRLLAQVTRQHPKLILIINKTDRLRDRSRLLPIMRESAAVHPFAEIIPLSARNLTSPDKLLALLTPHLPAAPPGYPPTQLTDRSPHFRAAELVREQTFRQLGGELPYASAVEITDFAAATDTEPLRVAATIWVEKASQKSIVIGKSGTRLTTIGETARKQMQQMFGTQVRLTLWVKVRKGWADNETALRTFGYSESL